MDSEAIKTYCLIFFSLIVSLGWLLMTYGEW